MFSTIGRFPLTLISQALKSHLHRAAHSGDSGFKKGARHSGDKIETLQQPTSFSSLHKVLHLLVLCSNNKLIREDAHFKTTIYHTRVFAALRAE